MSTPTTSEAGVMPGREESALVVLVPEAEPLVSRFRIRFDRAAIGGMPAHITLLYPFHHPDQVSSSLVSELERFFLQQKQFSFRLVGVAGFPDVIYLVPEPLHAFVALTRDLTSQYPHVPPYGGAFATLVPHLTVAQAPPAASLDLVFAEVFGDVCPQLPLECVAREATLMLKRRGQWSLGSSFELGS